MFIKSTVSNCEYCFGYAQEKLWNFYSDHSMLVSSISNLALNTILLLSKILKRIPVIVPRVAFTLLSFTGVLSINSQFREFAKQTRDMRFALRFRRYPQFVVTAARAAVKALNIFFTFSLFIGALTTLAGFPQIALVMYAVLRPVAMVGLAVTIGGELFDYFSKKSLLGRLKKVDGAVGQDAKVQAIAQNFIYLVHQSPYKQMNACIQPNAAIRAEQICALNIVENMDAWTLDAFKKGLAARGIGAQGALTPKQARDIYKEVVNALEQNLTMTKAGIGLRVLGYVSMGICRIFPQTLVQYGVTWTMSLFYTGKMIIETYLLSSVEAKVARA